MSGISNGHKNLEAAGGWRPTQHWAKKPRKNHLHCLTFIPKCIYDVVTQCWICRKRVYYPQEPFQVAQLRPDHRDLDFIPQQKLTWRNCEVWISSQRDAYMRHQIICSGSQRQREGLARIFWIDPHQDNLETYFSTYMKSSKQSELCIQLQIQTTMAR